MERGRDCLRAGDVAEQVCVQEDEPRGFRAGERQRSLDAAVFGVHHARIRGASLWQIRDAVLVLNAAQAVFREHRAVVLSGHADDGEDGVVFACGRIFLRGIGTGFQIFFDQGAERAGREGLEAPERVQVDGDFPAVAAGVFAVGADAAKACGIRWSDEVGLGQSLLRTARLSRGFLSHGGVSDGLLVQEGLGLEGAVALLDEHLHFAFGGVELLLAGCGQAYALFEELEGFFERKVAFLQPFHDSFELFEGCFKRRHGSYSLELAPSDSTLASTSAAAA
jgi:hypothetical protein